MKKFVQKNILYFAFIQALVATLGSIYFSEILHFAPCILCWYQRILMFPLVLLLAVGILRRDKDVPYYVLPLSITGMAVAFYQLLLQQGLLKETLVPCVLGASCTTRYIDYFGFITIPFLSFTSFLLINICMYFYLRWKKTNE